VVPYRDGRWRRVHSPYSHVVQEGYTHTCSCGKLAYRSKTEAKKAMREAQRRYAGSAGHWNAYKCGTTAGIWHYGHLPPSIVHGDVTRGEVYGDGTS